MLATATNTVNQINNTLCVFCISKITPSRNCVISCHISQYREKFVGFALVLCPNELFSNKLQKYFQNGGESEHSVNMPHVCGLRTFLVPSVCKKNITTHNALAFKLQHITWDLIELTHKYFIGF